MAAAAQALKSRAWDQDALDAMAPILPASPLGAIDSVGDLLHGSHLWEYEQGGQRVLIALRGCQLRHGRVLEVAGLVSLGDRMDVGAVSRAVETIAAPAYGDIDFIALTTRWAHLVRGCTRADWRTAGVRLVKPLREH